MGYLEIELLKDGHSKVRLCRGTLYSSRILVSCWKLPIFSMQVCCQTRPNICLSMSQYGLLTALDGSCDATLQRCEASFSLGDVLGWAKDYTK